MDQGLAYLNKDVMIDYDGYETTEKLSNLIDDYGIERLMWWNFKGKIGGLSQKDLTVLKVMLKLNSSSWLGRNNVNMMDPNLVGMIYENIPCEGWDYEHECICGRVNELKKILSKNRGNFYNNVINPIYY